MRSEEEKSHIQKKSNRGSISNTSKTPYWNIKKTVKKSKFTETELDSSGTPLRKGHSHSTILHTQQQFINHTLLIFLTFFSMAVTPPPDFSPEIYIHSPLHYAVAAGDHAAVSRLLLSLPVLPHPSTVLTESDAIAAELISDHISALIDRRDVPLGETPLHLTVRFNDPFAAATIAAAGGDISLQNLAGWSPLQEALSGRKSAIAAVLLRAHRSSAWAKWRRRLPLVIAGLRRMKDFYMEISFNFDSSVVPFIGKLAPSETCKVWKRGGNIRADTTVAGVDGIKIRRANQSFLFLGDGDDDHNLAFGSLLVLDHEKKRITEVAGGPISDGDVAGFCEQSSVYRPGMDVTKAEIVGKTNWRRKERIECIGEWRSKVYEVQNVVFSFRSKKSAADLNGDLAGEDQVMPLELNEDAEDGFLVAEYPATIDRRRHSSFVVEDRSSISSSNVTGTPPAYRKDLRRRSPEKKNTGRTYDLRRGYTQRKSLDYRCVPSTPEYRKNLRQRSSEKKIMDVGALPAAAAVVNVKEKEYVKKLRPWVWLTEEFPLKTEEILPLLDILSKKMKAVRRFRELLTAKFPTGTFPVKVAIPVLPAVRVVVTFTKFMELQAKEELFYTPASSPCRILEGSRKDREQEKEEEDPFAIPKGYRWGVEGDRRRMSKSKSVRK